MLINLLYLKNIFLSRLFKNISCFPKIEQEKELSTQRTLHAAVNTGKDANGELLFAISIPQGNKIVNTKQKKHCKCCIHKLIEKYQPSGIGSPKLTSSQATDTVMSIADPVMFVKSFDKKFFRTYGSNNIFHTIEKSG
jgi:hypothetical protein